MLTIRHPSSGYELEVAKHMFVEVYEPQGYERVDEIANMTRDELNAHAEGMGIADPESYPNKTALIDAIDTYDPTEAEEAEELEDEADDDDQDVDEASENDASA